ncbi:unnamed protein product [Durusdinium trenchii]|uniref:Uncharacterized protein n=1 Tax=Durusdinium trenchii TaxID=1381693 RepID=A0ABP0RH84_9DINO
MAGVAVAALTASGRKAFGVKTQLVALSAFENELGVQAPVGFWDPAGFTADGSVEDFKRRRQTELKWKIGSWNVRSWGRLGDKVDALSILPDRVSNARCHEQTNARLDADVAAALAHKRTFYQDVLPRTQERQDAYLAATRACRTLSKQRKQTRLRWKREWIDRLTLELEQANAQGDTRKVYGLMRKLGIRHELTRAKITHTSVADPITAREEWKDHFRRLQAGREIADEAVWAHVDPIAEVAHWLEDPPTDAEIRGCGLNMKNGKAAGVDGFLPEFYKYGSPDLQLRINAIVRQMWQAARYAAAGEEAQMGSRRDRSVDDALQVTRRLVEEATASQMSADTMLLRLLDIEKAYPRVSRDLVVCIGDIGFADDTTLIGEAEEVHLAEPLLEVTMRDWYRQQQWFQYLLAQIQVTELDWFRLAQDRDAWQAIVDANAQLAQQSNGIIARPTGTEKYSTLCASHTTCFLKSLESGKVMDEMGWDWTVIASKVDEEVLHLASLLTQAFNRQ